MNKKIKESYKNVEVNKKLEESILNMTINKSEKRKSWFKMSYALPLLLVVCIVSLTMVNADKVKNVIDKWRGVVVESDGKIIELSKENGYKEIPLTAPKIPDEEPPKHYNSFKELESDLGFKLLKPSKDEIGIGYRTRINSDGTIGIIDLWIPDFIEESEDKSVSVSVSIPNKYIDYMYYAAFASDDDPTDKSNVKVYKSNNLGVNVAIWDSTSTYAYGNMHHTATFVYDNVKYHMIGTEYTEEELKAVIENLRF